MQNLRNLRTSERFVKNPALQLIYKTYQSQFGQVAADSWLRKQFGEGRREATESPVALFPTPELRKPRPTPLKAITANPVEPSEHIDRRPEIVQTLTGFFERKERNKALDALEDTVTLYTERVLKDSSVDDYSRYASRQYNVRELFRYLMKFTLVAVAARGGARARHLPKAEAVTLFVGMDLIKYGALNDLGFKHTSFWNYLNILKKAGLIDFKGHKTDYNGETRNDGTLLKIKLRGSTTTPATLTPWDFKTEQPYRYLKTEVEQNHTLWVAVLKCEQSLERNKGMSGYIFLGILWTVASPREFFTQLEELLLSVYTDFVALFDAKHPNAINDVAQCHRNKRNMAVEEAAFGLAKQLGDYGSIAYYQRLLWQLLRARDRGHDFFSEVYALVDECLRLKREGYKWNIGALFVKRLQSERYYEELWRDLDQWVGSAPEGVELVEEVEHDPQTEALIDGLWFSSVS